MSENSTKKNSRLPSTGKVQDYTGTSRDRRSFLKYGLATVFVLLPAGPTRGYSMRKVRIPVKPVDAEGLGPGLDLAG